MDQTVQVPDFAKPVKLLFAVARDGDVAALIAGAMAMATAAKAEVEVLDLPRALELPSLIAMAERQARFDGYVAIGITEEATEIGRSLSLIGLQGAAIGNALRQTAGDEGQGRLACLAALHLIAISRNWAGQTKGIGFRP